MALRTVQIPTAWAVDPDARRVYGDPTLTGGAVVRTRSMPWTTTQQGPPRRWLARLELATGQTSGVATFQARTLQGLRSIASAEVHYSAPTGSTVRLRAILAGSPLWWNGSAWVAATTDSHWTEPATFAAALPSLSLSSIRSGGIALAVRMTTTGTAAPVCYGVTYIARVHYAETSASTTRGGSQVAEVTQALAGALASFRFAWAEELTASGAATVDFNPAGDSAAVVESVDGAWNVTDDPMMGTPLTAVFASNVLTFTPAPTAGKVLRIATQIVPLISTGGDRDLVADRLPAIVLSAPRVLRRARARTSEHGAVDGGGRPTVRAPRFVDLEYRLRVLADSPETVTALIEQLAEWFEGAAEDRSGARVTLPSAGLPVVARWGDVIEDLVEVGDAWQSIVVVTVARVASWPKDAASTPAVADIDTSGEDV